MTDSSSLIGQTISHYRIVEKLGGVRAAVALHSGDARRSIDALAASAPYELAETNFAFTFSLYPVYLRGQADLAAKRADAALAEFQKIADHSGVIGN
jgi:hypothetical protein